MTDAVVEVLPPQGPEVSLEELLVATKRYALEALQDPEAKKPAVIGAVTRLIQTAAVIEDRQEAKRLEEDTTFVFRGPVPGALDGCKGLPVVPEGRKVAFGDPVEDTG